MMINNNNNNNNNFATKAEEITGAKGNNINNDYEGHQITDDTDTARTDDKDETLIHSSLVIPARNRRRRERY